MSELGIVEQVYANTVEQICTQLFNALINPNNVANYENAERNFQAGIRRAQEIRDRAKQLLA
ncbi:MAG TPA: hypothetical protein VLA17_03275 [Candidatus Limnocylindria bacterium]|jgi:hypothetical protein|nr:hypothetical protein [Candidatus Limnocylindria bacterium]